ncbi:hypothetical protein RMH01_24825 [Pseudomonas aeruginosa]|uniref:hypothetical protein n=1 Tax=Pseudomonas aeruginosa TaxID=287 RepID=UPI000F51DB77|nr:hypothetical protein [Pseudomonas aeruginosa]MDS9598377.1 hypothetical protein [Pseudomonas aeruginosa]RPX44179.1 hypothetical protein IPC713_22570 [Pseudomonas aeruginosa]
MIKNDSQAPSCTCPSGDGSLVHPCPAHPAVEQVGGDECASKPGLFCRDCGSRLMVRGVCSIYCPNCVKAQVKQAEAERPEVFGLERYRVEKTGQGFWPYCVRAGDGTRELFAGHLKQCKRVAAQLATAFEDGKFVAGALRAENAKLSEALDRWPLIRDSLKLRLADALARVAALESKLAELEKQEPVAWGAFHFGGERDGKLYTHCETEAQIDAYILDMHRSSDSLTLRKSPLYAAPFAQNQPTVPDGYALIPVRETEAMHDAVMALLYKGVARTDTQKLLDAYIAAAPGKEVPQAWLDVQAERRRQVEAEGWTPEHDDEHSHGQIARAAACYALAGSSAPNDGTAALLVSLAWPWDQQWWKPSTPRRDLVKACALALAEIERLDRACISQSPQPGATTASS